ncbi:MBL fold metallo-hydrolase [Aquimarina intermedia]|uniref:L-ascorbate metabolism protein UlaG (Beta-lactamase superfamily) n=1 Tax=Aquimarina intermedia TaxID=350814 RepID=A0A5S5C7A5_9FLAO|nr:MBL fold metallo-hydrolase [Aquimarina intermedia]TYP75224.1 L-ascorbate metabolism protein UlaG (beta-lactamase superfamily) [Aquimarina intermedia]
MKINYKYFLVFLAAATVACKENPKKSSAEAPENVSQSEMASENISKSDHKMASFELTPISHATAVLQFEGKTIYLDPTGGNKAFEKFPSPDLVLITDIHGDHMDIETLNSLDLSKTKLVVPQAVAEKLPADYTDKLILLANGEVKNLMNIKIEAIPMYNLREEALKFHEKGRGNGYVLTLDDERVYFSGDTEDIPEMRNLDNIDHAFVCMNLPYTMTVKSAADAVLDFKPKKVYPYHYRGTDGLSDVAEFKSIVNSNNPAIEVIQLDWYPKIK